MLSFVKKERDIESMQNNIKYCHESLDESDKKIWCRLAVHTASLSVNTNNQISAYLATYKILESCETQVRVSNYCALKSQIFLLQKKGNCMHATIHCQQTKMK